MKQYSNKNIMKKSKKFKKGDEVVVISGDHKGKTGTVLKINGQEVFVSGVLLKNKKVFDTEKKAKKNSFESPIHISNIDIAKNRSSNI
jgi:large subunit ribosomal protein L24